MKKTFEIADDSTFLESVETLRKALYGFALDIEVLGEKNGRIEYKIIRLK